MRIAYLDCFSGISGDMFLGALIDAGVPAKVFEDAVEALGVGARLEISQVSRSGISATKVDVLVDGQRDSPREALTGMSEPHGHSTSHQHEHSHHHEPGVPHFSPMLREVGATHSPEHQHGRGLTEIREIIGHAALNESVKKTAIAIFEKLGEAEAQIHNVPVEKIHFHEVGAVDALVDIVCAAVGAEALGADEIVCSPLNVGGGMVECAHGTFPVPAPATVELLKGAPVYSSGIQAELVTPTGAAIVAVLVKRFTAFPQMKIDKTGYGAGTRDFPRSANVLRITVGVTTVDLSSEKNVRATRTEEDTISVLEANLDDLSPQVFGYVMERLLEAGALDVFATPIQMKKNRPGSLLTVLAKPQDAEKLTNIIFAETTTLGIRRREEKRKVLARRWETVQTQWGTVRMKIANMNGTVSNYAPEFEDCRRIASEHRVPLKQVMQEAVQLYLQTQKH